MQTIFWLEVVAIYPIGNTIKSNEGCDKYHDLSGPSGYIHASRVDYDTNHGDH